MITDSQGNFHVVWKGYQSGSGIKFVYYARISPDGSQIGKRQIAQLPYLGYDRPATMPNIAMDGNGALLVTWSEDGKILATKFTIDAPGNISYIFESRTLFSPSETTQ
jgi:hypothetical protein